MHALLMDVFFAIDTLILKNYRYLYHDTDDEKLDDTISWGKEKYTDHVSFLIDRVSSLLVYLIYTMFFSMKYNMYRCSLTFEQIAVIALRKNQFTNWLTCTYIHEMKFHSLCNKYNKFLRF